MSVTFAFLGTLLFKARYKSAGLDESVGSEGYEDRSTVGVPPCHVLPSCTTVVTKSCGVTHQALTAPTPEQALAAILCRCHSVLILLGWQQIRIPKMHCLM